MGCQDTRTFTLMYTDTCMHIDAGMMQAHTCLNTQDTNTCTHIHTHVDTYWAVLSSIVSGLESLFLHALFCPAVVYNSESLSVLRISYSTSPQQHSTGVACTSKQEQLGSCGWHNKLNCSVFSLMISLVQELWLLHRRPFDELCIISSWLSFMQTWYPN